MTNEELEACVMALDTNAFCNCRERGHIECKRHKGLAEFARALVSQAYEEAAQMAESMPLRHARFDFECAQESAHAIRALRDSLQVAGGRNDG